MTASKMSDEEISDAVILLKRRAQHTTAVGLWDLIYDAEALLAGRHPIRTRESIIEHIERELAI